MVMYPILATRWGSPAGLRGARSCRAHGEWGQPLQWPCYGVCEISRIASRLALLGRIRRDSGDSGAIRRGRSRDLEHQSST